MMFLKSKNNISFFLFGFYRFFLTQIVWWLHFGVEFLQAVFLRYDRDIVR